MHEYLKLTLQHILLSKTISSIKIYVGAFHRVFLEPAEGQMPLNILVEDGSRGGSTTANRRVLSGPLRDKLSVVPIDTAMLGCVTEHCT